MTDFATPGPGQMTLPLEYPSFRITRRDREGYVKVVQRWEPCTDVEQVRAQVQHTCHARCGEPIYAGELYFTVVHRADPAERSGPGFLSSRQHRKISKFPVRYHRRCLPDDLAPALIAFRGPRRPQ